LLCGFSLLLLSCLGFLLSLCRSGFGSIRSDLSFFQLTFSSGSLALLLGLCGSGDFSGVRCRGLTTLLCLLCDGGGISFSLLSL
jgi:hypothetical protein